MSKDSSHTHFHFHSFHHADLFEDFNQPPHLPHEPIYVPPQHQPPNPEDEDDVVPDQYAAFGIARATQVGRGGGGGESAWRDLGLEGLVEGKRDGKGGGGGMGRVLPR